MNKEYWVDDDGYIALGTGDDYKTVSGQIDSEHIQALTGIIDAFYEDNNGEQEE